MVSAIKPERNQTMTASIEKTGTDSMNQPNRSPASWDAMLAALRFALPFMEDLANSSDDKAEHRAAYLMRAAIANAEGSGEIVAN